MTKIIQKQRVWEAHEFELTKEQYSVYRKLPKEERPNFLDSIGGSGAEYENDEFFKYEVKKE